MQLCSILSHAEAYLSTVRYCILTQDLDQGSIYGLEKLWAFFAYSKVDVEAKGVERNPKVIFVCCQRIKYINRV